MSSDGRPAERDTAQLLAWDQALAKGAPLSDSALPDGPGTLELLRQLRQGLSPAEAPRSLTVGRFELRRELGRGTFGVVFLAYDPQLRREVALKLPRWQTTDDARRRFLREARAAALLDHPNLLPVHEVGEADGTLYIASAYCPGPTLAEWLRDRPAPVPARTAAALIVALAGAVQHAHERGVIHRDLKPGNVLLQPRTDTTPPETENLPFVPRVMDFGLAKLNGAEGESAALTHSGMIVGTVEYMAPEQAAGRASAVGPAADVYALGVILYELLTGRPPFRGETVLATLDQVRTAAPEPPSRRAAGVPRDLEAVCLKCVAKESAERYASATALVEDLRRFLIGEAVHARRRPGNGARLLRWCRRPERVRNAGTAMLVVTGFFLNYVIVATILLLLGVVHTERPAAVARHATLCVCLLYIPMLWVGFKILRGSVFAGWVGLGYAAVLTIFMVTGLAFRWYDLGGIENDPLVPVFDSMLLVLAVVCLAFQIVGLIGYYANRPRPHSLAKP